MKEKEAMTADLGPQHPVFDVGGRDPFGTWIVALRETVDMNGGSCHVHAMVRHNRVGGVVVSSVLDVPASDNKVSRYGFRHVDIGQSRGRCRCVVHGFGEFEN